ncbi:MAG TPA: hypothetical protein VM261_34270, partial [Kofleriaceae bacterium]|nr:hypothetical protein [Kofleriaceae bacterium]
MSLLGLILLVGVAAAEKPLVVVTGDDAAVVDAVEKAMRGKVKLVGEGERDRAAAIVEVRVTPTGKAAKKAKKLTATVVVTQGADDAEIARVVVKDRKAKLPKAVGKVVWKKAGKAVMRAKAKGKPEVPVAAAEPAPASTPAPAPEEVAALETPRSSAPPHTTPTTPTTTERETAVASETHAAASVESKHAGRIVVGVSERPFYRRLRWNDDLDDVLRRYDLAANAVGVSVAVRPLKSVKGFWVGVDGELVVGVNGSKTTDGMSYGTSGSELSAGLGYGVHIAGAEVALSAAFGQQAFSIDDEQMVEELVPDVTYRYARGGLDLAVPRGRWTWMAR